MSARRRVVFTTLFAALAGACTGEADAPAADADAPASEMAPAPDWNVRLDSERSDRAEFQVSQEDDGSLRIRTGPAGILWRTQDVARSRSFSVTATFVQYGAPLGYREAYGIFVGGLDMNGEDHEYTYLLVRPTGDFLVKRRRGETTENLVDWTPHAAVASVREEGDEPENSLAIEVDEDNTVFLVNGVEVHRMPTTEARPNGVAGLRANHRLDIRVSGWELEQLLTESTM